MPTQHTHYDVAIIGAGAAGLFCAAQLGSAGLRVAVLEKQERAGKKILISGGGRCNFTNLHAAPINYLSNNPHFCKSALARFTPQDFIAYVEQAEIAYHEKHRGQLFCDRSSKLIVQMLTEACTMHGVSMHYCTQVQELTAQDTGFALSTTHGAMHCRNLIIATGGLSFPKLGATDFGYRVAKQFGHHLETTQPALTPLLWSDHDRVSWSNLAGLACRVSLSLGNYEDCDDLLFTHTGLSGPVILRASLHWDNQQAVTIDCFPQLELATELLAARKHSPRAQLKTLLAQWIPARLASQLCDVYGFTHPIAHYAETTLRDMADTLTHLQFTMAGRDGYAKAEVTAGGVATDKVSSRTMESQLQPGLYFIGEVLDVTGELGGFNFQWAWASAHAAAEAIAQQ